MKYLYVIVSLAFLISCSESENAEQLVSDAINIAGGEKFVNTEIEFAFRDKVYGYKKQLDGNYEYVRLFKDKEENLVRDEVSNLGFVREVNGTKIEVPDSMAQKYSNSVNSVIYFALLPYGLNDAAVKKEFLGKSEIKGKVYNKVFVTFSEKDGGEDHDDEFIYWIGQEDSKVDYLAYKYHTDKGGIRFREAINPREINGLRFVDYINYHPKEPIDLNNIENAFINGQLEELSRIELDQISVIPL